MTHFTTKLINLFKTQELSPVKEAPETPRLEEKLTEFRAGREISNQQPHILIACMPKSGSTFISQVIANLPEFKRVSLVAGYDRREQELDLVSLLEHSDKKYVAQHHLKYSQPTSKLIDRFNLNCIVLTRNIFDVCVSYRDHIRNESVVGPMAYVQPEFALWSDEDLECFWADMIMPWYLNFFLGWQDCEEKLSIRYEDINLDQVSTISRILNHCKIDVGEYEIEKAIASINSKQTRKNVGVIGRGDKLHPKAKEKIIRNLTYYKDVDFSSITGS